MSINLNHYFAAAKKYSLSPFQLTYTVSTETSVAFFNQEVEAQQIGTAFDIAGQAILNGKKGSFATDRIDKDTPELMAQTIAETAKFGNDDSANNYFKGGLKYKKAKILLKDFKESNLAELRSVGLAIAKEAQAQDPRVSKVELSLSMIESSSLKANDLGMKAKEKSAFYQGYISVVCEDSDKEPRSGGEVFYSFHSVSDLVEQSHKAIKIAVKNAVDFFKSGPVPSKTYKAVLQPGCVSSLLDFYLSQLNAKAVQKHLSVFEGKVNQPIASPKLTLLHTPHATAMAATSYDSDGVPTQDFAIIKKGVLQDYFYSLETANIDKRQSNGCSSGRGNGSPIVVTVKPGKMSVDQLLAKMGTGLYISDISGLNSGIDSQTLNFSLPCQGYWVENGKIVKAVSMIIVAGNLKDVFENVKAVGNDSLLRDSTITPSLLISGLAFSGK
ncbi:MAG: TldD/PmbA family protein [Bacilli bacterium]|jgi:PmbA protein|nr:TldD/PmbA family protein [Bacilli bacterium]